MTTSDVRDGLTWAGRRPVRLASLELTLGSDLNGLDGQLQRQVLCPTVEDLVGRPGRPSVFSLPPARSLAEIKDEKSLGPQGHVPGLRSVARLRETDRRRAGGGSLPWTDPPLPPLDSGQRWAATTFVWARKKKSSPGGHERWAWCAQPQRRYTAPGQEHAPPHVHFARHGTRTRPRDPGPRRGREGRTVTVPVLARRWVHRTARAAQESNAAASACPCRRAPPRLGCLFGLGPRVIRAVAGPVVAGVHFVTCGACFRRDGFAESF